MKKAYKIIAVIMLVAILAGSFTGCAKINYITNGTIQAINEVKSGDWKNAGKEEESGEVTDDPVIDELTPGTYGGVEFNSIEDVVNYYVEAYNYTKTLTAKYKCGDGSTATYYKLLGTETLNINSVLIEGKENSMINSLVPSIVDSLFAPTPYGLVPCCNRNPELDNDFEEADKKTKHDYRTSALLPTDILACNVVDNKDGTITMELQPKMVNMSMRGDDEQGRFFEVLGDIGSTVDSIGALSWSEGTTEENCKVIYKGGVGTITIDTKTKEITAAKYLMKVDVQVSHANVAVLKDKSAVVSIDYCNEYPATPEFIKESKGEVLIG